MLLEEQNQSDLSLAQTMVDMFNDLGRDTFITQLKVLFNRVDLFDKLKNKTFLCICFIAQMIDFWI